MKNISKLKLKISVVKPNNKQMLRISNLKLQKTIKMLKIMKFRLHRKIKKLKISKPKQLKKIKKQK